MKEGYAASWMNNSSGAYRLKARKMEGSFQSKTNPKNTLSKISLKKTGVAILKSYDTDIRLKKVMRQR